jgi:uncharacterized protein (DUF1810 family)
MDRLDRFLAAQEDEDSGFETAIAELRSGRKRSHWIWYIFPQLAGLGSSSFAQRYGLNGVAEAMAYARHPVLRARLVAVAEAVDGHLSRQPAPRLDDIAGSEIDALKIVSSMTLFGDVARRLQRVAPHPDHARLAAAAASILDIAASQGIPACARTRAALAAAETEAT